MRAIFIVLAFMIAGCADPGGEDRLPVAGAPAPEGGEAARGPGLTYTLSDCHQMHAIFSGPADGWDPYLPAGFEPALDANGLSTVFVYPASCQRDGDQQDEWWSFLHVAPPSPYDAEDADFHFVDIGSFMVNETRAAALQAVGVDVAVGEVEWDPIKSGPTEEGSWRGRVDGRSYDLEYVVGPPGLLEGPWPEMRVLMWMMDGDHNVTGFLEFTNTEGEDRGLGGGTLRTIGDAMAPPVFPGVMHRVGSFNITASHVPWAPAP